jgi:hypothetical protein
LLNPETGSVNNVSVATSRKYPVAPGDADQFALNAVELTDIAADAVGATGAVSCELIPEFTLVPPVLVALSR